MKIAIVSICSARINTAPMTSLIPAIVNYKMVISGLCVLHGNNSLSAIHKWWPI